jgi:glycosyltransferase involved in cell wall biosynthesis
VLASGRAACDWETLFTAATPEWQLTVVCGQADLARVEALDAAAGTGARILSEVSRDEHDEQMRATAVYAMPLTEDRLSSGQVRLQTATELGAPVVVSRIATLAEYLVDGETALPVEVGDPAGLRKTVESLLADPDRRDRVAAAALDRARSRTYPDYFRDVRAMVEYSLA